MGAIANFEWHGGIKTGNDSLVLITPDTAVLGIYQDGDIIISITSKQYELVLFQYSRHSVVDLYAVGQMKDVKWDRTRGWVIQKKGTGYFRFTPNGSGWGDSTMYQIKAKGHASPLTRVICKVHPLPGQALSGIY